MTTELRLSLHADGQSLVLTTPSGRQHILAPDYTGFKDLLSEVKRWGRGQQAQRPVTRPGLDLDTLATLLSDYSRVCHCGRSPDAEPCEGCPGRFGAGKVARYDARGRQQLPMLELADLGDDPESNPETE